MGKKKNYRVTYFGVHHRGGKDIYYTAEEAYTAKEAQKRYNELVASEKWNYVTSYRNDENEQWIVVATYTELGAQ